MRIPASVPGNIIGYEIEQEWQPYEMTDEWDIQDTVAGARVAVHGAICRRTGLTRSSGSITTNPHRPKWRRDSGAGLPRI